jgi:ferritin-like metal-binding protein YciE
MPHSLEDELIKSLSDVYSLEQQALAQLREAPKIAGDETLEAAFRVHLAETEVQAEMVRERLEAYGESPSAIKDAVMKLGGKAFLLFARVQPDTPGKLTAHAYSYEALEWASYELLMRLARRAQDPDTLSYARTIRGQEKSMMDRLARSFDAAADASLGDQDPDHVAAALRHYLADAHALEQQSIELLARGKNLAGDGALEAIYREHEAESRAHASLIEGRLEAIDGGSSVLKDAALRLGALNWSLFFRAQSDTSAKLAAFVYAVEHLEIAGYELLRRVALRVGDRRTIAVADRIVADERAMAERVAEALDRALETSLAAEGAIKS